jgi:hypothetical protein
MQPSRRSFCKISFTALIEVKPPLMTNLRSGKSSLRRNTQSYFRGGMVLFSCGERPFSRHFLACIMNLLTPPSVETMLMKFLTSSYLSKSSTPSRHFTVTGIYTARCIDRVICATRCGLYIRSAPKHPSLVLLEGHPQFTLTSSYP